jgi:hypothetical protein
VTCECRVKDDIPCLDFREGLSFVHLNISAHLNTEACCLFRHYLVHYIISTFFISAFHVAS